MQVTEERAGEWVAILEMPIDPETLTELAGKLPPDAILIHIEQDGDSVYMTWGVTRFVPVD